MRILFILFAFIIFTEGQAQTALPASSAGILQQSVINRDNFLNDSNALQKKWFISGYAGVGAGFGLFNTGNAVFLPAQFGLQLNRRLTNNLYAFAGVSAAPAFFNFNRSFSGAELQRNYLAVPGYGNNGFATYSGIHAGLMYVNDQKTFSISGTISVSQGDPLYRPYRAQPQKQPAVTGTRQ